MPSPTKSTTDKKPRKTAMKTTPAKATQAETPAKKAAAEPRKTMSLNRSATPVTTADERHRLIAEAAYYRAEQRGFQGGNPDQDWYDAVAEVDGLLMERE